MRYRTTLTAIVWLLLTASAAAQIVVSPEIPRDKISTATMTAVIPDGAVIKGGWSSPTADLKPGASYTETYVCGSPGKHALAFSGYWVLLGPEITVKDVNGVDQTFQPHLGDGPLNFAAEFEVLGKADPPPPPPGVRVGVIVEETLQRTTAQASLYLAARKAFEPNRLLIYDQDQLTGPYWSKIAQAAREANLPLPVLVITAVDGSVVRVESCPTSVDGLKKELAK